MNLKPMLGYNKPYNLEDLKYPVYGSVKLDGIRCLAKGGVALSRKLLPIPNLFVQAWFKEHADLLEGLDGELIVGEPTAPDCYRKTMSGVMSIEGEPDFTYYVFDVWDRPDEGFEERTACLPKSEDRLSVLPQRALFDADETAAFEAQCIADGHEGIILRYPDALYKYGRSTLKEGALLKRKSFTDVDCTILDLIEAVRNDNEATVDELGHTKRSHAKEGRTEGKGYVGALLVRDEHGREGKIGTFRGLTLEDRKAIWEHRWPYIGKVCKASVMEHGGKDFPRHATWIGWRSPEDTGERDEL